MNIVLVLLGSAMLFGSGFYLGRDGGVEAERLRIARIFDVAFGVVTSGALTKVYRRVVGKYATDSEMRNELVRECEHRAKEREFRRRTG